MVGLQLVYTLREVPEPKQRKSLFELLPRAVEGWNISDMPLGSTEAINAATLKTLNLDDYVYRRFERGGSSFTVYAAYWAPGRMPTRLVASHTPDRCWTENGMRCTEMRFRDIYLIGGKQMLPGEYRAFVPPKGGATTYVIYWHTVAGELYDYGGRFNAIPAPWLWWKDTLAQAAYGSREQLFVRVSSETPLGSLWQDPAFQVVMAKIANIGLWAPGQPHTSAL